MQETINVQTFITPDITNNLPSSTLNYEHFKRLSNFQLVDPLFYESRSIDILLGNDVFPSIIPAGQQQIICGKLLGWAVCRVTSV